MPGRYSGSGDHYVPAPAGIIVAKASSASGECRFHQHLDVYLLVVTVLQNERCAGFQVGRCLTQEPAQVAEPILVAVESDPRLIPAYVDRQGGLIPWGNIGKVGQQ